MFSTLLGLLTSSIGESPDTVMLSEIDASFMTMSTWKFAPARSRISCRLNAANPVRSADTS